SVSIGPLCCFLLGILCLPPPDIPNGRHTGVIMDGFSYGSSVTYKCDSGYPLTGEASIHCTTKDGLNGEWSARPPRCGEVRCPAPQIRNGRRVSGDRRVYSYKDSVTFECNPGYTMKGHSLSQCQTDDTWDPPLPVCEPVLQCPSPPAIANGKPSIRALAVFTTGTSVNYSCEPGYSLTGQASIDCTASGTWSPPPPRCEGAFMHRLIGRPYRRCEISGTRVAWSGDIPICERIPCLPPPDIPNGKRTGKFVKNFSYGSAVTYKCDSGFPLIGEASIHCTTEDGLNGVWSAHPPRCGGRVCIGEKPLPALVSFSEVRCPAPQIQNGRRVSGDRHVYSYKDSVTFECDPGYTMKGHSLSQCQTDDTWDPPLPVCEPGKLSVNYCCDPDYSLLREASLHHTASGAWNLLQCPSPPAIANGKPSVQASAVFTTGTSVNYSCEPGYSLTGQASIYCMASGTWSPFPPQCEEVLCIAPEIEHGRKVDGRGPVYRPRDIVRFECDPGYTLNGSRQIQCQDEGTWDPPVPVCIQGKCESRLTGISAEYRCQTPTEHHPLPMHSDSFCTFPISEVLCIAPEIENGRKVAGRGPVYRPRDTVRFECDPGYTLNGNLAMVCLTERPKGVIGNTNQQNSPPTTPFLGSPEVKNGRTNGVQPAYRPRDIVVFECDPGYTLSGSPETQCQDDGRWDPPVPVCERSKLPQCPSPPAIANGKPSIQASVVFTTGTSVNYSCEPGYALTGQASIYCTASGIWSPPPPRCKEVLCIAPEIENGRKNGRTNGVQPAYRPRDIVVFECDPGYTLSGSHETQCQDDGRWDPPVPVCERSKSVNGEHTNIHLPPDLLTVLVTVIADPLHPALLS
uniref:Sushi domain-containing protein n=1 Tax=Chrysemys picta bellii TaxID=8478 RepID=A0A8C3HUP9_CHRPI